MRRGPFGLQPSPSPPQTLSPGAFVPACQNSPTCPQITPSIPKTPAWVTFPHPLRIGIQVTSSKACISSFLLFLAPFEAQAKTFSETPEYEQIASALKTICGEPMPWDTWPAEDAILGGAFHLVTKDIGYVRSRDIRTRFLQDLGYEPPIEVKSRYIADGTKWASYPLKPPKSELWSFGTGLPALNRDYLTSFCWAVQKELNNHATKTATADMAANVLAALPSRTS